MRRRHLLVLPAAGALLAAVAAPLAMAQSTDGALVHRESILADVDATGTVGTSRIFTQLTVPDGVGRDRPPRPVHLGAPRSVRRGSDGRR